MLRYVTTVLFFSLLTIANSQVSLEWSSVHTGNGQNNSKAIVTDNSGNIITVGTFTDTVQIANGAQTLISNGLEDSYILKSDPLGNIIWLKSFGGNLAEVVSDVICDEENNIVVSGHFRGNNIDFDPGPGVDLKTTNGLRDAFILKLTSAGDYMWSQTFGGVNQDRALSVSSDLQSNIYTSGYFTETVDFDPTANVDSRTSEGEQDIFLVKYNKNGVYQWTVTYGGESNDVGQSVSNDLSGNVFLSGSFSDTIDFDPGPGVLTFYSPGDADIFIQKLDSTGQMIFTLEFGDTLGDNVGTSCVDPIGNIYVSGVFSDTIDFNPGAGVNNLISNGSQDIFVAKYDINGQFAWSNSYGGAHNDRSRDILYGNDGYLYIVGEYADTVEFDPLLPNSTLVNDTIETIYLLKLSSEGDYQWVRSFGYYGSEIVYGVAANATGNLYVTGSYLDSINFDFDSGLDFHMASNIDAFVIKLDQCGDTTIASTNGMSFTANTPYGASFQWLDCDNNYAIIPGATSSSFIASAPGSYALMTTMYGCSDTSTCYFVTDASVAEGDGNLISVYPNPVSDELHVNVGADIDRAQIEIIDMHGKVAYREEVHSNSFVLSFDLSNGVYLLRLQVPEGTIYNKKLVVNR